MYFVHNAQIMYMITHAHDYNMRIVYEWEGE